MKQAVNRSGLPRRAQWTLVLFATSIGLGGCFLEPSIQREQTRREAFDFYTRGQELEAKGEYQPALDLYLKAAAQSPRPAFFYSAGVCHAKLGHDAQALDYMDKALALAPDYDLAKTERELILKRVSLKENEEKLARQTTPSTKPEPETARVPDLTNTDTLTTSSSTIQTTTGTLTSLAQTSPTLALAIPTTTTLAAVGSTTVTLSPTPSPSPRTSPTPTPEATPTARETPAPTPELEALTPEDVRAAVFPELYASESPTPTPAPGEVAPGKLPEFHFPPSTDNQARLAVEAGRFDQAAFYLEKEVAAHPTDWELRLRLARVLARAGRLSRTESELREAARLAPDNADVWYEWGGFYVRQENWGEADRCYRECLRIDPNHVRAHNNFGVVLLRLDLLDQAYEQFQAAVNRQPDFASPYLNLAIIEANYRKNVDKAVQFADDYIRYGGARADEVRRWRQDLLLKQGALPAPAAP